MSGTKSHLPNNMSNHILPKFLVLKTHLNVLAEKGTGEGCLKDLSLEDFATTVEDVRADVRFGDVVIDFFYSHIHWQTVVAEVQELYA